VFQPRHFDHHQVAAAGLGDEGHQAADLCDAGRAFAGFVDDQHLVTRPLLGHRAGIGQRIHYLGHMELNLGGGGRLHHLHDGFRRGRFGTQHEEQHGGDGDQADGQQRDQDGTGRFGAGGFVHGIPSIATAFVVVR
jgi:hypothetical protein